MAATYDGVNTDYVFFQSSDSENTAVRGMVVPHSDDEWTRFDNVKSGLNYSSIALWYCSSDGPLAVLQNDNLGLDVASFTGDGGLLFNNTLV